MRLTLLVFVPLGFLLASCSDGGEHLQMVKKHVEQIKAQPAKTIEPLPELKPVNKVIYSAHKLRSPFAPPKEMTNKDQSSQAPNLNRKKQALEAFSLDSLKMVGTIKQSGKLWALIEDPTGNIRPVTIGNYLGKHHGQIIKVLPDAIKIMERVHVDGQWKSQLRRLILR